MSRTSSPVRPHAAPGLLRLMRPLSVLSVLSVLGTASPASATPTFPKVVQSELGLDSPPPCAACHVGGDTRSGDMTPLARSLMSRGLEKGKEASLRTAIAALDAEGTDSDGDGVGDIDELREGTNPSGTDAGFSEDLGAATPVYGCTTLSPAGVPRSGLGWILGGLGALFLVARRRGRAPRLGAQPSEGRTMGAPTSPSRQGEGIHPR